MEITNRSGIQCLQHPREQITNFCVQFDCLKPLCPDCVQTHTKVHQKQQIQSWKRCINKSAQLTKNTLDELKSIYQMQRLSKGIKTAQTIESENVRRLGNVRQKYHRLVDQMFNAHQNALRLQIRNLYKIDQPDTSKLKLAIQEMEKVLMKLAHSNTVIPALKKCLLLDHKALVQYFGYMKNNAPKAPTELFFNQNMSSFANFRLALQKCINLEHINPEPAQKYSSPGKERRYSNHISVGGNDPFEPLKITSNDYFKSDCKNKYLHFFIPCSNDLKVLHIEQSKGQWKLINFKSKNELPCYFKSIITPTGDIYLTGGSQQQRRCRQIFKYNFEKNNLQLVSNMKTERSSHSICYLDNKIYIIGGFTEAEGDVTRQCQVFNLQTMGCNSIAPLNTPSANSCATSFNNQFIFKIGGIFNKLQGNSLIQVYSIKNNRWINANIQVPKNIPQLQLLSFSAAVQINQTDILVFGGYDNSEIQKPQRICYALSVSISNTSVNVSVKNYNTTPLPFAEAFWNNNPIIQGKQIYALQNITDQQDQLTALADQRRVIVFNGERWL